MLLKLGCLLCLAGCVGQVSDRAAFFDPETAFVCELDDAQVVSDILTPRCLTSGCHDSATSAAGLDLASENVALRLLGAPSSSCRDKLLLDDRTPFAGYLFEKLHPSPGCGVQMPPVGNPLTETEVACLHRMLGRPWAEAVTEEEAP